MWDKLYINPFLPVVTYSHRGSEFLTATFILPDTGSKYRITFLSPVPHYYPFIPLKTITKRNQDIRNIKKKLDLTILPYLKKFRGKQYKAFHELIEKTGDMGAFLRYSRLQIVDLNVIYYLMTEIQTEITKYLESYPELPMITFFQYRLEEAKIEIGFLLNRANIYTRTIFEIREQNPIVELNYRELYLLPSNDLYYLSYYYFYFLINFYFEFWSIELVESDYGLRVRVMGFPFVYKPEKLTGRYRNWKK